MATALDNDIESGDEVKYTLYNVGLFSLQQTFINGTHNRFNGFIFFVQFEDALEEIPLSKENGYTTSCDSKPIPIANPDAFEFLLPMILGIVRI